MIKTIKNIGINVYLMVYVFTFFWWLVYPCPLRTLILRPVADHIFYFGLWQGWGVFSPNINRNQVQLGALVKYDDGSVKNWHFPRPETYGLIDQMFLERYRKYGYDHASRPKYSYLFDDYARYVARMNTRTDKKINEVVLYKYWQKTPPLKRAAKGECDGQHYREYFTYKIKPGDAL